MKLGASETRSDEAREAFMHCQRLMDANPLDENLKVQEKVLLKDFSTITRIEEECTRQIKWLVSGGPKFCLFL